MAPLKILVVDDVEENLSLAVSLVGWMGHEPLLARNGQEAVEVFRVESPDMVLMDVMMPVMNGYEATVKIREICGGRWVPIVFLSALGADEDLVKGLEVGGDDYLSKPLNLVILQAKINAFQRIAMLQGQLLEKTEELERYYDQAEEEQRIGSHIMERLTNTAGLRDAALQYRVNPAQHFSGDLVAAARTPGQVLHVMLADATGHGLAAALNVFPLTQIFYSMTYKGFSLTNIIEELNHKVNSLMPADRFVAAMVASIDVRNGVVEVWNGGSPSAFFMDDAGQVLHTWKSRHLPLGILNRAAFDARPEVFPCEQPGQLVLCSDGLVEAENEFGEPFSHAAMVETLAATPAEGRLDALLAALVQHLDGRAAHDDVSLMLARYDPHEKKVDIQAAPVIYAGGSNGGWHLHISVNAAELRYLDVVPLVLGAVEKIESIKPHVSPIFLIVSELFTNALDHGLLGLDSSLKASPEGFETYMDERQQRLEALTQGSIEINFEQIEDAGEPVLRIRIKDSGPGFNHSALLNNDMAANSNYFGRGVPLVRTLSSQIEYLGCGNDVVAHFRLQGERSEGKG